jgi:hypothetical protein
MPPLGSILSDSAEPVTGGGQLERIVRRPWGLSGPPEDIIRYALDHWWSGLVVASSKVLDAIDREKHQPNEKSPACQPNPYMEVTWWLNEIDTRGAFIQQSRADSLQHINAAEIHQEEANHSSHKTQPCYFDERWQNCCPWWRYALGKSHRKGKCRRGECTDFLRELIHSGEMVCGRLDYFFYVYLGWWHEHILLLRRGQ